MLLKSSNQKDDSSNQDNTQESFYTGESDREDHLIDWVVNLCYESQNVPPNLTIHSIYLSNSLSYIMHQMCPEQFTMQLSITELETLFIDFFFKQYGFYVKPLLSVESKKQIMMIKLVLYACIYSQQKEKFVSNILKLPSQTQEKIVAEIQKVQSQLKHLKNWDRMIEIMKQLEAENNQLTDLLNKAEVQAEEYQSVIKAMSQQLEETKKQRNLYIVEKRKLLSNFELSSFAEYQDLCTKLQVENESLTNRQKQLLKVINEMEEETYQLHKELHNSDIVITELNKQYVNLQRNYLDMTKQVSNSQDNNHIHTQQTLHEIKSRFSSKFITKAIQITDKVSSKKVSIIHKKKPSGLQNLACDIFEKIEQNIGRSGRSSARNLFNTTKNIVQLNQRINDYEEMLEQQKHHLIELQNQIAIYENKQRFYLKKIRKIQRISDCFSMEYDNIIDGRFKVVHFQPQLQHV